MLRILMAASALVGSMSLASPGWAATASPFAGETVFGDSLSDGGNLSILEGVPITRFTTNPGLTSAENVGAFFGLSVTPSLAGGTNYAYGGAGVLTDSPGSAGIPTLTDQIDGYLAANPRLNPNELYSVLGGANDIFYHATSAAAAGVAAQLVASATAGQSPAQAAATTAAIDALVEKAEGITTLETTAQATIAVAAAATQELSLISALQKAGAHYIVVVNLPNIGATPSAAADEKIVAGTAAALTGYSNLFNSTLNAGLASMKVGIIPVNTYALLNEILATPATYGFVNTTVPACTTSSSFNCTPQTLVNATAASNYVFADGVHPTTATHALFAQVIESEIIAPQQASLLAEQPLATLEAHRNAMGEQVLQDQTTTATGLRMFATGGYVHQHFGGQAYTAPAEDDDGLITGGVDYRLNSALTFGAALSGGSATETLSGQFRGFKTNTLVGSAFAQYVAGPAYVNVTAGYGALEFHDIKRSFALGPALRGETADADGHTELASASAGYWFDARPLQVGPFVSAVYERVRVDAYHEGSGDSTAMTFGGQTRESLLAEIGLRARGSASIGGVLLNPFAEIAYTYDADARQRDVVGGLTTMNGQFAIPGFAPDRDWAEAQVGAEAAFTPKISAYAAYQGRFAGRSSSYDGANVGLRYRF